MTSRLLPTTKLTTSAVANSEADPDKVFHLKNLGAVFYRAGRFDEALARFDEAESLQGEPDAQANSSAAYTWFFLAMTHYRLGNVDEARQVVRESSRLDE